MGKDPIFINMDRKLLPKPGRKGVYASKRALMKMGQFRDDAELGIEYLCNTGLLEKDLEKVCFDVENLSINPRMGFVRRAGSMPHLRGYHTAGTEFSFIGCEAGGDWEFPLFFILYYDGKNLRGYVPTYGNTFNTDFMAAFGSEQSRYLLNRAFRMYGYSDLDDYKARAKDDYDLARAFLKKQGVIMKDVTSLKISINWDAIAEDIETRFSLKTPIDRTYKR